MLDRFSFTFHNPNHAAALICALMPLCWGWRRCAWIGWTLSIGLFVMLLLTQSRTGLIVAAIEVVAWLLPRVQERKQSSAKLWLGFVIVVAASLLWMWPRLELDGSILNRPKIWLAGLQLFAANPNGVGLGNSGALASVFMFDGVPPVRTMINSHITLLAEFGWIAGVVWFAFILLAALGIRKSPRIGIAFFGLALSAFTSTIFDWEILFDVSSHGRLGLANWISSWTLFLLFVGYSLFLIVRSISFSRVVASGVIASVCVCSLCLLPVSNVPVVQDGFAIVGDAPRTLALYDRTWPQEAVHRRAGSNPHDVPSKSIRLAKEFLAHHHWSHLEDLGGMSSKANRGAFVGDDANGVYHRIDDPSVADIPLEDRVELPSEMIASAWGEPVCKGESAKPVRPDISTRTLNGVEIVFVVPKNVRPDSRILILLGGRNWSGARSIRELGFARWAVSRGWSIIAPSFVK